MMYYKLYDAFDSPETIEVSELVNGRVRHRVKKTLVPGKEYSTDDEVLINSLKNLRMPRVHSPALERLLRESETPFEYVKKSCNYCARKISYKVVRVYG